MDEELYMVKACAILHDIGKLPCWLQGEPPSRHVKYTYDVLKDLNHEVALHARRHHDREVYAAYDARPEEPLERIVCLADTIASGADRPEEEEAGGPVKPPIPLGHPLATGPIKELEEGGLRKVFLEAMGVLRGERLSRELSPRELYEGALKLEGSLTQVPADTRFPDVSLWDHLRLTSAIATCLWLDGYRGGRPEDVSLCLVALDADGVARFINRSPRPRDLSGRSEAVKAATKAAAQVVGEALGRECVVFAGGGNVLFMSPTKVADELISKAREAFESKTYGGLTATAVKLVVRGDELKEAFNEALRKLGDRLREAKLARRAQPQVAVGRGEEACYACGVRKATRVYEVAVKLLDFEPYDANPRPFRLCESCYRLRQMGRGISVDEVAKVDAEERGVEEGVVAVIKADGDRVGRFIGGEGFREMGKRATPSRVATFSRLLDEAIRELSRVVGRYKGVTVYAGGDDTLAIVPGYQGLKCALEMAEAFNRLTHGRLTMSAGVVFVRGDFPMYIALEEAHRMLGRAKDRAHSEGLGCICFQLMRGSGPSAMAWSGRGPYTWVELKELLYEAELVAKSLEPSQFRKLLSTYRRHRAEALSMIRHWMTRGLRFRLGEALTRHVEWGRLDDLAEVMDACAM